MQTKPVTKNISLQIFKGKRVALTGKTGCCKTTLVNLIMGLFPTSCSSIFLDGKNLWDTDCIIRWRDSVAHVPQNIFLADCTIGENIAFEIPKSEIDYERLVISASKGQILNFILTLPDQFDTVVGERGVRLSGGQRQRIGIARALYKKSTVLVLDEATSALDLATEGNLMDSIYGLDRDLTIIMIAHRLSTVELCDRIISIDELSSFQPSDI